MIEFALGLIAGLLIADLFRKEKVELPRFIPKGSVRKVRPKVVDDDEIVRRESERTTPPLG